MDATSYIYEREREREDLYIRCCTMVVVLVIPIGFLSLPERESASMIFFCRLLAASLLLFEAALAMLVLEAMRKV